MASPIMTYFAPCPRGLEAVLADELRAFAGDSVREERAGVAFSGPLETGYRACLELRSASRVLLEVARFPAADPEALYDGARTVNWEEHLGPDNTLAVDFSSTQSAITHTNFGALKVKDAVVDWFRDRHGRRPSVAREQPDVRINVHIRQDVAHLAIDLAGESLHRRSWRAKAGAAPLKENLACGILLLADYPAVAAAGGTLLDPMCGAGTLVIEGALMAADVAPGLLRGEYGFLRWRGHNRTLWRSLLKEARERDRRGTAGLPLAVGCDADPRVLEQARENARAAGVEGQIRLERMELSLVEPVGPPGVVVVNPPYGERLAPGDRRALDLLYNRLGMTWKQRFGHWTCHLFTGNLTAAKAVGLRAQRRHELYNGALECRLLAYPILPPKEDSVPDVGAEMLINRVRKNQRKLKAWLKREQVECYRLYSAELPEFAFAVDVYANALHVQENERPDTIDPLKAEARLHDGLVALSDHLGIPRNRIFVKQRQRQRGSSQYEKQARSARFQEAREGRYTFLVNLTDYFDTGLFLDHRPIRFLIGESAADKHVLNLFAYTGTATVHAAGGGARSTTTVDLSNTYLEWAQRNLEHNGLAGRQHRFEQADVMAWLARDKGRYDLIFVDPPTFSNSKRMKAPFDVQQDHVELLRLCGEHLRPGGTILFSNNFSRFKLDSEAIRPLCAEEITASTIPPDFERTPRIHRTWRLTRGAGVGRRIVTPSGPPPEKP